MTLESFIAWREKAKSEVAHNAHDKSKIRIEAISARTKNHYLQTVKAFCHWAIKRGRLASNPFKHVEPLEQSGDIRRARRELTPEEALALLAAVPNAYKLAYHVALQTGLRAGELAALQWGDIRIDAPEPFIQLRAETTKAKRGDVLPIRADLADMLRAARGNAADAKRVFHRIPRAKEHKRWLEAAGIPYCNEQGERADFHALRHTYVSWLAAAGVSPKELMTLARHTDPRLTLGRYSHVRIYSLKSAVEKLPALHSDNEVQAQLKTGTDDILQNTADDRVANRVATMPRNDPFKPFCVRIADNKTQAGENDSKADFVGELAENKEAQQLSQPGLSRAGDGARTHDIHVGNVTLYH